MQSQPQSEYRSNKTMRRILDTYYLGGTDAVRALLRRNKTSEEKINIIVAQLQQNFPDLPLKSTMPRDGLQSFINNVYVVRTLKPDDWIDSMSQSMNEDARHARERKDLMRVAFFEALAAIVKDEQVTMADDNPYKKYIVELIAAIEAWKRRPI
jgi:hypothetical protein